MKLSDIFEAYLDKFYRSELGQAITKPGFTFGDLATLLAQQGIYLEMQENSDRVGSASIMDIDQQVFYYKRFNYTIPEELNYLVNNGYKHVLYLNVYPGTDYNTEIREDQDVNYLVAIIQHELQHAHQPPNAQRGYSYPSRGKRGVFNIDDVDYISQAVERPAMAVNIANDFVANDVTIEEFVQDIKQLTDAVMNNKKVLTTKNPQQNIKRFIQRQIDKLEHQRYYRLDSDWTTFIIANYAYVMFEVKHGDQRYKDNALMQVRKIKAFIKQLQKTYKRVKGYQSRYH